ncbi:MAG: hypothetical protein U0169_08950 [Polyangiaceae bacterium]
MTPTALPDTSAPSPSSRSTTPPERGGAVDRLTARLATISLLATYGYVASPWNDAPPVPSTLPFLAFLPFDAITRLNHVNRASAARFLEVVALLATHGALVLFARALPRVFPATRLGRAAAIVSGASVYAFATYFAVRGSLSALPFLFVVLGFAALHAGRRALGAAAWFVAVALEPRALVFAPYVVDGIRNPESGARTPSAGNSTVDVAVAGAAFVAAALAFGRFVTLALTVGSGMSLGSIYWVAAFNLGDTARLTRFFTVGLGLAAIAGALLAAKRRLVVELAVTVLAVLAIAAFPAPYVWQVTVFGAAWMAPTRATTSGGSPWATFAVRALTLATLVASPAVH